MGVNDNAIFRQDFRSQVLTLKKTSNSGEDIMVQGVIIYGKAGWPHTDEARLAFGDTAVYYDVKQDQKRLSEMLKHSDGVRSVPVIVDNGKVTIGHEGGSWGV